MNVIDRSVCGVCFQCMNCYNPQVWFKDTHHSDKGGGNHGYVIHANCLFKQQQEWLQSRQKKKV